MLLFVTLPHTAEWSYTLHLLLLFLILLLCGINSARNAMRVKARPVHPHIARYQDAHCVVTFRLDGDRHYALADDGLRLEYAQRNGWRAVLDRAVFIGKMVRRATQVTD